MPEGFGMNTDKNGEIADVELIRSYLDGNPDAFDALYERYKRILYGYLNKLFASDRASADDVFQKTWLKAIDNLAKYRNEEKFSAWLMRISHNLAIDHFRVTTRRAELSTEDEPITDFLPAPDSASPWYQLDREELGTAISEAVQTLPEAFREVFLLRQQDVAFKDIAQIQSCSLNTCLARMQYAMKHLRKRLREWNPTGKES